MYSVYRPNNHFSVSVAHWWVCGWLLLSTDLRKNYIKGMSQKCGGLGYIDEILSITVNMRVNIAAGNSVPRQKSNSIVREDMFWRYRHVNNPDYMVSVWIRDWVLFSQFSTDVPKIMKGAKWILSLLSINLSKRQFEQIGYVQEKRSRRSKWSVQDKKCVL